MSQHYSFFGRFKFDCSGKLVIQHLIMNEWSITHLNDTPNDAWQLQRNMQQAPLSGFIGIKINANPGQHNVHIPNNCHQHANLKITANDLNPCDSFSILSNQIIRLYMKGP